MFLNGYEWSEERMKKRNNPTTPEEEWQGAAIVSWSDKLGLPWEEIVFPLVANYAQPSKKTQSFMPQLALFVQLLLKKCEHQMCCLKVFKTLLVKA